MSHHWSGNAGDTFKKALAHATFVTQPDFVDGVVFAGHDAHQFVLASINGQITTDRAVRADARRAAYFPHTSTEAEVGVGQGTHGTDVGGVARELRIKARFRLRDDFP